MCHECSTWLHSRTSSCLPRPCLACPSCAWVASLITQPIVFWDERLSTVAVERTLLEADSSRKRRAEVVDKLAAAYILQGALDRLAAFGRE